MDLLLRSALPLSVNLNRYATKVATHMNVLYVSFIGLRLTKTSLTLINRTRLRTNGQSAGYPQAQIGITSNSLKRRAPSKVSSSLAVLLEVKTTHSSAVLSLHLSQCFTPPLKSIPVSFFPHAPCPPSWIPSLPAILTPVLRMCHLCRTTYATLGACLSADPIWWGNFLRRGNPLKGGRTLGA